jgi:hypothetical protein
MERFSLEPLRGGLALRLREVNGRTVNVPAAQIAGSGTKENWLRMHKIAWHEGESEDVVGILNRVVADHRASA